MKYQKQLKYIFLAATLLFMGLIFWFSAQPADESTEMSNHIGYTIGTLLVPEFEQLDSQARQAYVESIDHAVRKSAHGCEYLLLGFLCAATLLLWFDGRSIKKDSVSGNDTPGSKIFFLFFFGWLIAVLYAVSDEIHQIFVPGRACMAGDVLIDAGGSLAGVLILLLFFVILSGRKRSARKPR